jgi:hypothetical protein
VAEALEDVEHARDHTGKCVQELGKQDTWRSRGGDKGDPNGDLSAKDKRVQQAVQSVQRALDKSYLSNPRTLGDKRQ